VLLPSTLGALNGVLPRMIHVFDAASEWLKSKRRLSATTMKKLPGEPHAIELLPIVPEPIRGSVSKYVKKASHLQIDSNRVLLCACLLAVAERDPNCHLPAGPTLPMVPYETIGAWFGLSGEECDPEIVIPLYRRARKAMQRANQSGKTALRKIKNLDKVLRGNHEALPAHLKGFRARIWKVQEPLSELILGTEGGDLLKIKRSKVATEIFNVSQLTFVWWRICLHGKRTPWEDMFQLAKIWRLTDCSDVGTFRRHVLRLSKRVTGIWPPPRWCLKLCHT
jgi:hypothetical protein